MSMTTEYSRCPRSIVLGKTGLCVQDEIGLAKDTVQPADRLSKMITVISEVEMALYNLAMYYKQMQITQTKVNANNSNENEIR